MEKPDTTGNERERGNEHELGNERERESKWLFLHCWSALSLSRPSTSPTSTASPTSNTVVIFESHSMLLCNL